MPRREFLEDIPNTYMARLTNRQWRLVVSALSESGNEECEQLASELLFYVLPPCAGPTIPADERNDEK